MRRRVLLLLVAGCSSAAAPAGVTLAPAAGHPTTSATGSLLPASARQARPIAWQWSGDEPGFGRSFYRSPRTVSDGALECTFTYDEPASLATTACASEKRELWRHDESHAFVEDAALVLDRGTLYSARFSNIASGCTLYAFEARTGALRWRTPLAGAGPVDHSEYLNAVQIRMIDGRPVVFGWESAARYVEAVDPASGADAFHAIAP